MGFTNEMWGTITLNKIIEDQQNRQRIVSLFNDYTALTNGERASAYNGPVIGELTTQSLPAAGALSPTKSVISIVFDKKEGVIVPVDTIEDNQTGVNMVESYASGAGLAIASKWDSDIVTNLLTVKPATQLAGQVLTLAVIRAAKKSLNAANAPTANRYLIIGPSLEDSLYDIPEFISYDKIGSTEAIAEGRIGRVQGFEVVLYNDMPQVTGKDQCIFAQRSALGFARQRVIDVAKGFDATIPATIMNFFSVYGSKVQNENFYLTYRQKD